MREVRRHTADDAKLFLVSLTVTDSDAPLVVTLFGNYSTIPLAEPKAVPAQDQTVGRRFDRSLSCSNGIHTARRN